MQIEICRSTRELGQPCCAVSGRGTVTAGLSANWIVCKVTNQAVKSSQTKLRFGLNTGVARMGRPPASIRE